MYTPMIAPTDLGPWMGRTLAADDGRAEASIRIAEGWLLDATRIDPWPTLDPPEDLRAWVMELSALVYVNNPKAMTERQVGGVITQWAPDDQAKRQQILNAARSRYNQTGMPQGSFPPAQCWPDAATDWPRVGVYWW